MIALRDTFDSPCLPRGAERLLVFLAILIGCALRLWKPELGYFSLHTTRDLYRAQELLRGIKFPLLGSELQYGGRTFGPLMYILCAIPLAIRTSPLALPIFIEILNCAFLPLVWWWTRRFFGRTVALWTIGVLCFFPLEIAQLRLNWNPCFLPLFTVSAFFGLLEVVVNRKPWHLVTVVFLLCCGIQLHLSAMELAVTSVIILLVGRVRIPIRVLLTAAAVVLVMFSPLIINEITSRQSAVAEVIRADRSKVPAPLRHSFNPNSIRNFFLHERLWMFEEGYRPAGQMYSRDRLGFHCLETMTLLGKRFLGDRVMKVIVAINLFGQVQLILWFAGVIACFAEIRRYFRARRGTTLAPQRTGMVLASSVLLWHITPVCWLLFFNYHDSMRGNPMSLVPIRYYLVNYPTPFLLPAIGLVSLARGFSVFTSDERVAGVLRRCTYGMALFLFCGFIFFDTAYLVLLRRSGQFMPYQYPNFAPTLGTFIKVRDILLDKAKIDRNAFYERLQSQQFGQWPFGESTIDWLIMEDPRSITNPSPDPNLRWIMHSSFPNSPQPVLPAGATETHRWTVDGPSVTVVEYRVDDPAQPVPDSTPTPDLRWWYYKEGERAEARPNRRFMLNYYYQHERLNYLGPEKELRERGRN